MRTIKNVINYGRFVPYKNIVEIISLFSAYICITAIMPELFGISSSTLSLVIQSSVLYLLALLVSFPISNNFKQALANSIGSIGIWFGFLLLLFSIGFGITGKLELFSLYVLLLVVSGIICGFSGLFIKIWWGSR